MFNLWVLLYAAGGCTVSSEGALTLVLLCAAGACTMSSDTHNKHAAWGQGGRLSTGSLGTAGSQETTVPRTLRSNNPKRD